MKSRGRWLNPVVAVWISIDGDNTGKASLLRGYHVLEYESPIRVILVVVENRRMYRIWPFYYQWDTIAGTACGSLKSFARTRPSQANSRLMTESPHDKSTFCSNPIKSKTCISPLSICRTSVGGHLQLPFWMIPCLIQTTAMIFDNLCLIESHASQIKNGTVHSCLSDWDLATMC
jgi:hypothetical protein